MSRSIFADEQGRNFALPFILISCLFFLSGYTNALLDVLNKYFQEVLGISKAESGLVQFSLYSGYFLMAIPAGLIINRFGFNRGLIFGLFVLIAGTALFIPGAMLKSYYVFLFALFIIACGFTFFETAANPYATLLGRKDASTRRINLAQSFNGIGWIIGPLVGGLIIFSDAAQAGQYNFDYLPIPFVILGVAILVIVILLLYRPLPDLLHAEGEDDARPVNAATRKHFSKRPHFVLAIISQFFYVAAQTGINSFFINYVTEADASISNQQASVLLSFGGMSLFVIGRFSGSYVMKWMKPDRLLSLYAVASVLLMLCAVMNMKNVFDHCAVHVVLLHVDHVSDDLRPGDQRFGRADKEGGVVSCHGDHGRGIVPDLHGVDCRSIFHGDRIRGAVDLLCLCCILRLDRAQVRRCAEEFRSLRRSRPRPALPLAGERAV